MSLWYKAAGQATGPVVLFLHGGPGYNAYAFEKAVGALLEPHLRMVYLDQRGCARSWFRSRPEQLGIENTVADIEKLRAHLGAERIFLIGHSFGGLVALEYQRAHPEHVGGLILAETSGNIVGALEYQLATLAAMAPERFPDKVEPLRELTTSRDSPFQRIMAAYGLLGRLPLQRQLHFASDEGQRRNEALDAESGLMACDSGPVASKYFVDGFIDSPHPELMKPLAAPAIVFGGRRSHVIGEVAIQAAARAWNAEVRWFENSGHFIYLEEPEAFARAVVEFVSRKPSGT
ncbi:alpha/beta hydrolase [Pyxidicoccus parkwayensis]|uniref:Alpha/beta hydrolase n=1 Tax=Pyxidicoccus parkwayensis TaxID=2813578 RepID=A0ABX7PAF4_9BACT|nr:alpha/beta hydrolase [Pyxidicoccus parkwaysis]QSQ27484.1 alpha/beta hydrolase [Pyxidicoccus parkwaysis]